MRILAVALAGLLPTASAGAVHLTPAPNQKIVKPAETSTCQKTTNYHAYRDGKALKPQKLTELPPADMYIAVFRHDEKGCEDPIVVKYRVGAAR